jgi:hypothetical protein
MKGDFSRLSFDRRRQFSAVLLQQGRVLTDADFNEQAALQQDFLRRFVVDLVGTRWRVGDGFALTAAGANDFAIAPGRFYLGGLLCANDAACTWRTQPMPPRPPDDVLAPGVAYVEAWERAVSAAEDPSLLEPALGGTDTSVRSQIVWQVRLLTRDTLKSLVAPLTTALKSRAASGDVAARMALKSVAAAAKVLFGNPGTGRAADALFDLLDSARPRLRVRTQDGYRGQDNRFYRIEIHDPGTAGTASFKWSRDNGGTVFAVTRLDVSGSSIVATLAARDVSPLRDGDWVELADDSDATNPLLRIVAVDPSGAAVTLTGPAPLLPSGRGTVLRRWDQRTGVVTVAESANSWIALEDGIEIQFAPGGNYNSGDYWTVPARPAIGEIMWPVEANGAPRAQIPHGICRYRAALASLARKGRAWQIKNNRARR